jgi:uncharacterized protein YndB with AHSA1/START domain
MIKKLILGLLAVIVIGVIALVVVISTQPSQFKVTRSSTFDAPPETVFAQVNDFHNWAAWSPWEKLDPNMKRTITGPPSGKGATYAWTGNDQVGEGKMTITESKPNDSIKIDLEFIKPFAQKSITDFTLKPEGGKTTMTWTMAGDNNFISKAFCMVMDMDKMIGADFEKGLNQLKPIVESAPRPSAQVPAETK